MLEKPCRVVNCDQLAIGSKPYCASHNAQANEWLREQAKLDFEDDVRGRLIEEHGVDWTWDLTPEESERWNRLSGFGSPQQ